MYLKIKKMYFIKIIQLLFLLIDSSGSIFLQKYSIGILINVAFFRRCYRAHFFQTFQGPNFFHHTKNLKKSPTSTLYPSIFEHLLLTIWPLFSSLNCETIADTNHLQILLEMSKKRCQNWASFLLNVKVDTI